MDAPWWESSAGGEENGKPHGTGTSCKKKTKKQLQNQKNMLYTSKMLAAFVNKGERQNDK